MLLLAEHLSLNYGTKQLLEDVSLFLNPGDKVGIIGINGTGKSTLLRLLASVLEPDTGTIARDPNVQVSYLAQNPAMDDQRTVLEQVFSAWPPEFRDLKEYEARAMLTRLGITEFSQQVGTLSGGQRKRVALAAALIHHVLTSPIKHILRSFRKFHRHFFHIQRIRLRVRRKFHHNKRICIIQADNAFIFIF